MKNGIAMISNFSMPVNSFSATDSIGTVVIVNRKVSTVRPSEIEIGMPVSISPISSAKMIHALFSGRELVAGRTLRRRSRSAPASATTYRGRRWGGRAHGARGDVAGWRLAPSVRAFVEALDVCDVVVRQLAGARERHLQEAEAHQVRAERDAAQVDDPVVVGLRDRATPESVCAISQTKVAPSVPTMPVNSAPAKQAEQDDSLRRVLSAAG